MHNYFVRKDTDGDESHYKVRWGGGVRIQKVLEFSLKKNKNKNINFLFYGRKRVNRPHSPTLSPNLRIMEFDFLYVWCSIGDTMFGKRNFVRVAWFLHG